MQINKYILTLSEVTKDIQISLKNYLKCITLLRHGIINFDIIYPRDLQIELEKIQAKFPLPLPTLENTCIYYQIMNIKSLISRNLLIISLDIPIVTTNSFTLYKMYPLPTSSHRDKPRLSSYVEPSKPYLLVSGTKTVYSTMMALDNCLEYLPSNWLRRHSHPESY